MQRTVDKATFIPETCLFGTNFFTEFVSIFNFLGLLRSTAKRVSFTNPFEYQNDWYKNRKIQNPFFKLCNFILMHEISLVKVSIFTGSRI